MESLCIHSCLRCSKELVMWGLINNCNHPYLSSNSHPAHIRRFKEPKPKRIKMLKGALAHENAKRYVDLTDEEESPLPQVSDIGGPSQTSTPLNSVPVGSLQLSSAPAMPLPEQQCRPKSMKTTLWTPPAPISVGNQNSQTVTFFNNKTRGLKLPPKVAKYLHAIPKYPLNQILQLLLK